MGGVPVEQGGIKRRFSWPMTENHILRGFENNFTRAIAAVRRGTRLSADTRTTQRISFDARRRAIVSRLNRQTARVRSLYKLTPRWMPAPVPISVDGFDGGCGCCCCCCFNTNAELESVRWHWGQCGAPGGRGRTKRRWLRDLCAVSRGALRAVAAGSWRIDRGPFFTL
jgi:hypothetical protein